MHRFVPNISPSLLLSTNLSAIQTFKQSFYHQHIQRITIHHWNDLILGNYSKLLSSNQRRQFCSTPTNQTNDVYEHLKTKTIFRTEESDPTKHRDIHEGLFYTIPSEISNRLFLLGGLDKEQQLMMKTFRETSIMIRKPALEIINRLNTTDFTKPPNKFVLRKYIHNLNLWCRAL